MKKLFENNDRRRLITGVLRFVFLAAIAIFAAVSFKRAKQAKECTNLAPFRPGCRGCNQLQRCKLPQALSAKLLGKRENS